MWIILPGLLHKFESPFPQIYKFNITLKIIFLCHRYATEFSQRCMAHNLYTCVRYTSGNILYTIFGKVTSAPHSPAWKGTWSNTVPTPYGQERISVFNGCAFASQCLRVKQKHTSNKWRIFSCAFLIHNNCHALHAYPFVN